MEIVISAVAEYFDICGDEISHCELVAKTYGHVEGGSRSLGNCLHDVTTRNIQGAPKHMIVIEMK
jgi:Mn-containing catalase